MWFDLHNKRAYQTHWSEYCANLIFSFEFYVNKKEKKNKLAKITNCYNLRHFYVGFKQDAQILAFQWN